MKKRRETSGPQVGHDQAALILFVPVRAVFLMRNSMSDGRLIPAAIITAAICGILIYSAFFASTANGTPVLAKGTPVLLDRF
jgi:hypothetical protein